MKSLFILSLLPLTFCTEFVPSDEANLAYFNIIKSAFNSDRPAVIYNMFSKVAKDSITLDTFASQIEEIKIRSGNIAYWTYVAQDPSQPYFMIGYDKKLTTGSLVWTYSGSQFVIFSLVDYAQPSFVDFIKNYPNKVAFTAITDGEKIIEYNGKRDQDLMSVFKITIAIEYSRQVSEGILKDDIWVNLDEINKFYITDYDIGQQNVLQLWKQNNLIKDNKVQLINVAKGMIVQSSNACSEFLQTLLTVDKIQEIVTTLNLYQTQSYYLCSYLLTYFNFDNLPNDEYIEKIASYTQEYVLERSKEIHQMLVDNSEETKAILARGKELLDPKVLAIQTKYFTKSSSNAYAELMEKLNTQQHFSESFYKVFYPLIGAASLQNLALAKIYTHVGVKGGSSGYPEDVACVLTTALFSELSKPYPFQRISYTLFMEDLLWDDYVSILLPQMSFTGLISINGYYLQAVAAQFQTQVE